MDPHAEIHSNIERISVRRPIASIRKDTPVHWLDGDIFRTQLANTVSLLFPDAEGFFIRTVKKFLPKVYDSKLKNDIQGFIGQEMQHKKTHERTWLMMEDQGFHIHGFLEFYNSFSFRLFENLFPDKLNLSIVSGLEHFTALFSESILKEDLLKNSDPILKDIFEWHCAEELEHKHVAFDLLKNEDDSYRLRIFGFTIATLLVMGYSISGIMYLFLQYEPKKWERIFQEAKNFLTSDHDSFMKVLSHYVEYLSPDFHPNDRNTIELSKKFISKLQFESIVKTNSANTELENSDQKQSEK